jgi:hypothetical protein
MAKITKDCESLGHLWTWRGVCMFCGAPCPGLHHRKTDLSEKHANFKLAWAALRAELENEPADKELHDLVSSMDAIAAWEIK